MNITYPMTRYDAILTHPRDAWKQYSDGEKIAAAFLVLAEVIDDTVNRYITVRGPGMTTAEAKEFFDSISSGVADKNGRRHDE